MKYNNLTFTNKDCIQCFDFTERELHYLAKVVRRNTGYTKVFRTRMMNSGGSGKYRILNFDEFYLFGLLKLLINIGFTAATASKTILQVVACVGDLESLYRKRGFTIGSSNRLEKLNYDNTQIYVDTFPEEADHLGVLTIHLDAYTTLVSEYIEKEFVLVPMDALTSDKTYFTRKTVIRKGRKPRKK